MSSTPRCFQLSTARAATSTLIGKGLRRFLVADEVGLGKTLVASQVILGMARARGGLLTVFYVTSGRTVAGQNKARLLDFGEAEPINGTVSRVDRLGLIPSEEIEADLRLYAFSPTTSFPAVRAKASLGQVRERAFLYHLLIRTYPALADSLPLEPFVGRASRMWPGENRLAATKAFPQRLQTAYRKALTARLGRGVEIKLHNGAFDRPAAAFMTDLRLALAHAALIQAQPDLVIFDEFQCYRDLLLDKHGVDDHVRRGLIEGTGDGAPAMLLLSATPYRLADDRKGRGTTAHAEFHELLGFLGGASIKARSEQLLERFRHALAQIAASADGPIPALLTAEAHKVRSAIETMLAPIMSRTERDDPTDDLDRSTKPIDTGLKPGDLDLFRALAEGVSTSDADQTDRTGSRGDALAYWLSVPLAAQALGPSYKFWERGTFMTPAKAPRLTQSNRYGASPDGWGSPKLRGLAGIVRQESLALPWVAPSLPWWELGARWHMHGEAPKALVFSKYRATPLSIAALMSLEVERVHLAPKPYRKAWITKRLASRTNTIFNLFHVSPFLIAAVDPLASPCGTERDAKTLARGQLSKALAALGISTRPRRKVDARRHRPSWRVLAAIEAIASRERAKGPLKPALMAELLEAGSNRIEMDDSGALPQQEARSAVPTLACVSKAELADLADLALGSPAVVTARALARHFENWTAPDLYAEIVSLCWGPLRRYFDNPIFWSVLPGEDIDQQIHNAVIGGGFEALLDEHVWTRKASLSLDKLLDELRAALGLGAGSFTFQGMPRSSDPVGVRCHAALPFAGAQADTTRQPSKVAARSATPDDPAEGPARSETIRTAFNTPFWPHLLATTSVGQEGLDFHNWCDQVVHWDLCSSPVDLEQREGRIQRFASLTIRRTLAGEEGGEALAAAIGTGRSPWVELERLAEQNHSDDTGLSPWWTLPNARVRRYLFSLPGGRDALRFRRLQDQRLVYRLALGQPNPEDFLASLHRDGAAERLKPFLLNLSAISRKQ